MIKAIFFDVDGTLLSHRTKQIPQDTKRVLRELQKNGIKILWRPADIPQNYQDYREMV